jgi:hypothetical protein
MAFTKWAGVTVDAGVARLVDEFADSNGLPRNVLRAFVLAESGGNPGAEGDAGASIGLLQLHERGQGAGLSVAERKAPRRNLEVGVPAIARAWKANAGITDQAARVERTAAESGHPGDPRQVTGHNVTIAETGIANILTWWHRLEGTEPTTSTSAILGLPADRIELLINEAIAFGREHPVELIVLGAALVLLS